ncbi:pyridoxine 5'-phosphate synthase [Putridiphycobacter roseus]|uniref:Pyridoxine 5'-phosphate synthase n=1 Tax=Putridiphycobacter roseus TaxID=2219161 RepID=A0A2W1MXT1_9FLAO|nr:pyridoxine 5'-phosphate synthase [Putridiphycobacter roseus]PZE16184.1 pyridoxine 5'-phosphate synthase [Putridiphycobacter roseus]
MGTKLSVNINKIATIRNARGGNTPNLVEAAKQIQSFGAEGITIHPRPDERHITKKDVYDLKKVVYTEYNIEGYPNDRFMALLKEVKPTQATLVPDPPGVLTSNAGWDTLEHFEFLKKINQEIKAMGIRTSIFIETNEEMIAASAEIGVDRIEFYTGPYAAQFSNDKAKAIAPFTKCAELAEKLNLGINAGHDLSLENLKFFKQNIPGLLEVSIGHALISDALYLGLENTVKMYKDLLVD